MAKMNEKLILILILGLLVHQHRVNCFFTMITSLISFAWSAFEMFQTAEDAYLKYTTPSTADLLEKSEEIAASLEKWGAKLEAKIEKSTEMLLTRIPLQAKIDGDVRLLNSYIGRIDSLYGDMKQYMKQPELFTNASLTDMLKVFTANNGRDVATVIDDIFKLIVPQVRGLKESLFLLLAQETQVYGLELCGTESTPQQRLVDFYDMVMESEMKAFAMMGFGYSMYGVLEKVNRTADIKRAQVKLLMRGELYLKVLKATLSQAGRQFRQCDPPQEHERDVTFYEFERFLQKYVVQSTIFTPDNRCSRNCGDIQGPSRQYYGCTGFECRGGPTTCYGRLALCADLAPSSGVCEYYGPSYPRRYEYIDNGNEVLGANSGCNEPAHYYSAPRIWLSGVGHCYSCQCVCVEDTANSMAKHYISLREQITNVDDNMVAVGFALVIVNKIAHIKVMQGQLASGADILENSTSWLELEDIHYDRDASIAANTPKFVKKTEGGEDEELVADKDVAVLTWGERTIHLDDLRTTRKNYVITGVRFRRLTKEDQQPIQLEVHITRFDAETGQLDLDSSIWFTPDDTIYAKRGKTRSVYDPDGYDNPLRSRKTTIGSKQYSSTKLDWTSVAKDAGQTVIPLLDGIPVTSKPPTPLSGLGIYYKSQPGYAGFLTLVLEGINLAPFVPTTIDEE